MSGKGLTKTLFLSVSDGRMLCKGLMQSKGMLRMLKTAAFDYGTG